MGYLACIVADAEAIIEHGGAQPHRQAVVAGVERLPEAHVVARPRALAGTLFEGQILLSVLIEEVAHRRVEIRPVEKNAADDPDARTQRDRVGGPPPGRVRGTEHVVLRAFKPDIDNVAGETERGPRRRLEPGEPALVLEMAPEEG